VILVDRLEWAADAFLNVPMKKIILDAKLGRDRPRNSLQLVRIGELDKRELSRHA
jgi:hypothetical protein